MCLLQLVGPQWNLRVARLGVLGRIVLGVGQALLWALGIAGSGRTLVPHRALPSEPTLNFMPRSWS